MNPSYIPAQPDLTGLLVASGVFFVLGIGGYLWYAFMLSRVFAKLGAESWKAWVPVLNEAEILRLGGVPSWSVVYYFLPVVVFYGLYLKAVAATRIDTQFGRGVGSTVLAILLPPVWATLLDRDPGPGDRALQERIAPSTESRSGYAFAVSTPQPPAEPQPPAAAAGGVPPLATPLAAPPPLPPPPLPPPPPPPAAAVATPAVPTLPPPPELIVPPPGIIPPPPPAAAPSPAAAPPPVELPAQPWAPLDRPAVVSPPVAAAPAAGEPAVDDASDEIDRTVVVDRRPVIPWRLVVEGGPTFRLSGARVVLGRRPDGAGAGAQEIAVPDSTRTLSKVHARLDLADGVWTITDLNATNGVIVIGSDGTEQLLDPGASAPLTERFVLGKVGMRVTFGEGDAAR